MDFSNIPFISFFFFLKHILYEISLEKDWNMALSYKYLFLNEPKHWPLEILDLDNCRLNLGLSLIYAVYNLNSL